MKTILRLLFLLLVFNSHPKAHAQCAAGYNQATLNWDYLDYLTYTGNYTSANGYLASNALVQTQNFAFGTQRLTITNNFADASVLGDNTAHTGDGSSNGTGADINFNGNGTITLTFENEVANLRFSIYDLDNSQQVTVTAANAASVPLTSLLTRANGGSAININNIVPLIPSATGPGVDYGTGDNNGTLNVTVAGPVKTVTLVFSSTAGDFWVSDITACSAGNFPTNYYNVSQPFTGMPGYVLHSYDKGIYAVNPVTGASKLLFTDPFITGAASSTNRWYINSMAYDPYNRVLYYVYSLTSAPGNNRTLKKYDFNTGTISTVLADISTIGIPVVTHRGGDPALGTGVESGAAAFYNGALYLGIEATDKSSITTIRGRSSRETVVWRIDFNGSNIPYRASQVFAMPMDDGNGDLLHDWSDFTIKDGVLYDFDGANSETDIFHYNLLTGGVTNYSNPSGFIPGQPTVNWNGDIYQMHAVGSPATVPYIAPYNGNGTIGARINMTNPSAPSIPSLGDAAEGFRPLCDFGDAPSTYDPVALSPAVHEIDNNIRLGATIDREWIKAGSAPATLDGSDEDGITFLEILYTGGGVYNVSANVFNNTGANATLGAWIDFNGNGIFETAEGITRTINTSASAQSVTLAWTGISTVLPNNTNTYIRLRITSQSNAMTTASATGYFNNGEVEDYRLLVNNAVLSANLSGFKVQKADETSIKVRWDAHNEEAGTVYILEKTNDNQHWLACMQLTATTKSLSKTYNCVDKHPFSGASYYRVKMMEPTGKISYSNSQKIDLSNLEEIKISPNPAKHTASLDVLLSSYKQADLMIVDMSGTIVYRRKIQLQKGANHINMPIASLCNGVYTLCLKTENELKSKKLVVRNN